MFHYEGSLTTPGCAEIVQWIVLDKPLYVRQKGLVSGEDKSILDGSLNLLASHSIRSAPYKRTLTMTGRLCKTTIGQHKP